MQVSGAMGLAFLLISGLWFSTKKSMKKENSERLKERKRMSNCGS